MKDILSLFFDLYCWASITLREYWWDWQDETKRHDYSKLWDFVLFDILYTFSDMALDEARGFVEKLKDKNARALERHRRRRDRKRTLSGLAKGRSRIRYQQKKRKSEICATYPVQFEIQEQEFARQLERD